MTSTPPNDPRQRSTRSLTSRTSLLTAAAIAGVLLAGTAAVAANIGILNAADSSTMGDLTATDELLPAVGADADTATVTAETAPSTSTTLPASPSAGAPQQYDIAGTGTVWVMTTRSGLALDHVVAEPGWSSVLTQGDLRSLQVDFTNGDRTIVFTAALGGDGTVVVDVTEPTTVLAQAPALTPSVGATPTTAASGQYDDDDQYEDEDHDEYESESEDHDEYEDEDHEYEGADDDD
jgi:hypothetical protein